MIDPSLMPKSTTKSGKETKPSQRMKKMTNLRLVTNLRTQHSKHLFKPLFSVPIPFSNMTHLRKSKNNSMLDKRKLLLLLSKERHSLLLKPESALLD